MFEAFKIGVKLSLVNEVSHGLMAMARDFQNVGHHVDSLQRRIQQMGTSTKLAFGGALAIGVGASLAMTLKPAIEAAEKWDTAKRKFTLFGMSEGQNNEAFAFAQNMNIAGSTYVENLQKMTEAQGAFREANLSGSEALAGSKLAAPMLARLAVIGKDSGHEMSEADDKNLIRAIEMSGGLKDAKTFNDRADAIYKLVGSSGGNVGYEDVRAFYARGGVAAKGLTDEALMKLEPIIGEMKGTSAGTALMTAFNRLNGNIKLPNQIMHELVDSGVWNAKNITWNSQGGAKNIKSDGLLKGADLLASDPVAWEKTVLEPMYEKLGLVTQNQKNNMNLKLFGRTGGAEFSLIQSQASTIERSPDAIRKNLGIVDAAADLQKGYKGQKVEAAQRFEDLLTNIGTAILPSVNAGLTTLNGFLKKAADFTRDNPGIVKAGVYLVAISSGILILGGSLALFAAGMALVSWPITLTIAAMAGLIALGSWLHSLNWAGIWDGIKNSVMGFFNFIGDAWKHRPTWLGGDGENALPKVGTNQATQADRDYYAATGQNSIFPKIQTAAKGIFPSINPNQSTQADRDYYAATRGTNTIKTAADAKQSTVVYADFGNGFEKGVTKAVKNMANELGPGNSSTRFDFGAGQAVPGQTG